jgi:hypothetical protein
MGYAAGHARWAALAGVGFVVLTLVGDLLPGKPPKFDERPTKIAAFFLDNHREVLVGLILTGIASALLVWLVAGLAVQLRAVGQPALGAVALAAGVAATVLGAAADTIYGALAQIVTGGNRDFSFVRDAYQLSAFLIGRAFWLAALLVLVSGLGALRGLTRWYAWTSFAAVPLLVLGGLAVKQSGFFAPGSGMTVVSFVALLVWVLATSLLLWQLEEAPARGAQPSGAMSDR